jgi:hypothetical protein
MTQSFTTLILKWLRTAGRARHEEGGDVLACLVCPPDTRGTLWTALTGSEMSDSVTATTAGDGTAAAVGNSWMHCSVSTLWIAAGRGRARPGGGERICSYGATGAVTAGICCWLALGKYIATASRRLAVSAVVSCSKGWRRPAVMLSLRLRAWSADARSRMPASTNSIVLEPGML